MLINTKTEDNVCSRNCVFNEGFFVYISILYSHMVIADVFSIIIEIIQTEKVYEKIGLLDRVYAKAVRNEFFVFQFEILLE